MCIALIAPFPTNGEKHAYAGGMASYTANLLSALQAEQPEARFVVFAQHDARPLNTPNLRVVPTFRPGLRGLWDLWRTVKPREFELIHLQQEIGLLGGPLSAALLPHLLRWWRRQTPVVVTVHGVVNPRDVTPEFVQAQLTKLPATLVKWSFARIFRPLSSAASRLIVHTPSHAATLYQAYGANQAQTRVIAHGVEQCRPQPQAQAKQALFLKGRPLVLFNGYLSGYKNLELLIEGFHHLLQREPRAFLLIAGGEHPRLKQTTSYRAYIQGLRQQAAERLPAESYRFEGFIPEASLGTLYSAADVAVFPYRINMASSGPMALAVAHSTPFLASDLYRGDLPDDLLFSLNPEALATTLYDTLRNPERLRPALEQIRQTANWQAVARQTTQLYQQTERLFHG